MSISPIDAGTVLSMGIAAAGRPPSPQQQKAQVDAQADLMQAVQNVDLPLKMVLARLSDGRGVDLYM